MAVEGYDLELPHGFARNEGFYTMVTFLIIPLMALGGIWFPVMVFGTLVLSSLTALIYLDVILGQDPKGGGLKTCYHSAAVVLLSAWAPALMFLGTPYLSFVLVFTAIWTSVGMHSVIRYFSVWRAFWQHGPLGLFGGDPHGR